MFCGLGCSRHSKLSQKVFTGLNQVEVDFPPQPWQTLACLHGVHFVDVWAHYYAGTGFVPLVSVYVLYTYALLDHVLLLLPACIHKHFIYV